MNHTITNKYKIILLLSGISIILNIVCFVLLKNTDNNSDTSTIEILPLDDIVMDKEEIYVLLTDYSEDNKISYLCSTNDNGDIQNMYCLDDQYFTLGYDGNNDCVYVVGEKNIIQLNSSISYIKESTSDINSLYQHTISYEDDKIKVTSEYCADKDSRISSFQSNEYFGYIHYSPTIHMMEPVAIIIKH